MTDPDGGKNTVAEAKQPKRAPAEWRAQLTTKDASGKERPTTFGRWVREMSQGSEVTADENARKLVWYAKRVGRTPDELATMAKQSPRAVLDELSDVVHELQEAGKSGGYIKRYVVVLESWLRFNEIALPRRLKVRRADWTPTLVNEGVPTQLEVRQILALATVRGRVICSMMAFTGVRPETLGTMRGMDGLKLGDFPELDLAGPDAPQFTATPARVVVRAELSKSKRSYLTFLPGEGCEALLTYLRQRINAGEELQPNSPLIPSAETGGFLWTRNLTREVRAAMRKAGNANRPYVLRSYHSTAMLTAESRQGLPHAYAQHWCGHVGDMDARYSINKGRLPGDLVEDMRNRYAQAAEFLTTGAVALDNGQVRRIKELEETVHRQEQMLRNAEASAEAMVQAAVERAMAKLHPELEAVLGFHRSQPGPIPDPLGLRARRRPA